MIYLRSSLFALGYAFSAIFFGILTLPLLATTKRFRHRIIIGWTQFVVLWAQLTCGLRYKVIGLEHLKDLENPVIVLSKHQSAWETFYLQSLFFPACTVLKKELLSIPFFGWGLASLQPIAINRSEPRKSLVELKKQSQNRLNEGLNIILFPEGTRVEVGQRVKYARSGADIAKKNKALIVPISHNAGTFWSVNGNKFLKKSGTITVVIGEPINCESIDTKVVTQNIENWIEDTLEKINVNHDTH